MANNYPIVLLAPAVLLSGVTARLQNNQTSLVSILVGAVASIGASFLINIATSARSGSFVVPGTGRPVLMGVVSGLLCYVLYNLAFGLSAYSMVAALQSLEAEGRGSGLSGQLNSEFMMRTAGVVALVSTCIGATLIGRRLLQHVPGLLRASAAGAATIFGMSLCVQAIDLLFGGGEGLANMRAIRIARVMTTAVASVVIFGLCLLAGGAFGKFERRFIASAPGEV